MAALSSSSFLAPVARRLPTHKVSSARAPASTSRGPVLIPRAIYTESARVPGMDPEDRRRRETERVLERTQEIHTLDELSAAFSLAGDKLVMVAVESDEECTMADDAWSQDSMAGANLESCKQLSASLSRIAREADEVAFLRIQVTESGAARDLAHGLGVYRFPTYQYYKVRPPPPLRDLTHLTRDPRNTLCVKPRCDLASACAKISFRRAARARGGKKKPRWLPTSPPCCSFPSRLG